MDYIIVAFRSRSHTIKFANILREQGFAMEIINTPKEAGVGCGLSVKFRKESFEMAKRLVLMAGLTTFAGFFSVKEIGGKRFVRSV
ncbi:MAG: DUF3343 domain-containing protein [Clostridiales bacterium]|nr:DUF3343 domain-containing protein [Clostridiales bacterium]